MISGSLSRRSGGPVDDLVLSHPPCHDMIPYSGSEWGEGSRTSMLSLGVGVNIEGFRTHSLRATTATNALDHEADIANMQESQFQ